MVEWGAPDAGVTGVLGYTDADGYPMTPIPFLTVREADASRMAVLLLSVLVLVNTALLFNLMKNTIVGRIAGILAFAITVWATGPAALPMTAAAALAIFGAGGKGGTGGKGNGPEFKRLLWQSAAFYLLWVCLLWAGAIVVISSALILGFSLYVYGLLGRLARLEELAVANANKTDEVREMLGNQRRVTKSAEHVSRLEERNRLAARIHDEIGHGMSGSILLLEGADLVMAGDPEKARATIRKVTENLRASVEEIRKVLREERSVGAEVNLARIENEMASFESDHAGMKTYLEIKGEMEDVNSAVWVCIYENMVEAMTNTLKHTSATQFRVSLKNNAGLLHVEFSDNGGTNGKETEKTGPEFRPGIGLQSMEERTAMCHGRCFFSHRPEGFHIVMTFPRRGNI